MSVWFEGDFGPSSLSVLVQCPFEFMERSRSPSPVTPPGAGDVIVVARALWADQAEDSDENGEDEPVCPKELEGSVEPAQGARSATCINPGHVGPRVCGYPIEFLQGVCKTCYEERARTSISRKAWKKKTRAQNGRSAKGRKERRRSTYAAYYFQNQAGIKDEGRRHGWPNLNIGTFLQLCTDASVYYASPLPCVLACVHQVLMTELDRGGL
jgi:hypothetical protein